VTDREYSRLYHEVVDDPKFRGVFDEKDVFGWWATLLIMADQSYPNSAYLPYGIDEQALAKLTQRKIVVVDGPRFRLKGLDSERKRRSNAAASAANMRWQSKRNATAVYTPDADLCLAKPSQAESKPSQVDAGAQAYYAVKGGQVSPKALEFVDDLVREFGDDAVASMIGEEATRSKVDREFLSRVKSVLLLESRRRSKAADAAQAKANAEYQREMQAGRDAMTPEQQAKADEARAGVADLVRSM